MATCYVATACHGEHDQITQVLRMWRNERLVKKDNKLIVWFIIFYSNGFGERMAKILEIFPFLKPIARFSIRLFAHLNKISLKK